MAGLMHNDIVFYQSILALVGWILCEGFYGFMLTKYTT